MFACPPKTRCFVGLWGMRRWKRRNYSLRKRAKHISHTFIVGCDHDYEVVMREYENELSAGSASLNARDGLAIDLELFYPPEVTVVRVAVAMGL